MIILCDSRENAKVRGDSGMMEFDHETIEWCQICALPFGDYWCVYKGDVICPYVVERKAIGDFFGSFGKRYEKERDKLERFFCNEFGIKYYIVAIEGTISEVIKGYKHSQKNGRDLFRTMMTWYVKYNVNVVYAKRDELEFWIPELFYSYGMKLVRDNKKQPT